MQVVFRALLWLLVLIAPGGVFLLPLVVGDAMARRRRGAARSGPAELDVAGATVSPIPASASGR